ncbi:nuclear transport factor 2 family protein [Phreatobacter sp. AB_2022a]|uniref:nuclear transport factor 2 family protein n=1 Tax=Phreatobacter sp. AB_2022a TaxID=3003134 RepID=UPI0022871823|nr:nuclear transport factor 2 family protein [Phreatobacter sp. AB_2022a]MCZ0738511.1 nuclear transport factor 2 family protein [Phreatobacter sp. AB_2022a]
MDRRSFGLALAAAPAAALPAGAAETGPEANKKVVLDFYEKALNQMDFDAAARHFGPRYIQHNPVAPDGIDGFKAFIAMRKERFPRAHNEIKRVIADGDLVALHVHSKREPADRGLAIVDIFRLEAGKIVEHWDVIQPIPETAAHTNGMF